MTKLPVYPVASLCSHAAFDVVAIAASVGGIHAIRTILAMLPTQFPAAIVVQTHLNPKHHSDLVDILQRHSTLLVEWAADDVVLQPGTVTVAPPGQHVQVLPSGQISLTSWMQRDYAKPRADGLFESVAASFNARAIGVVLTGYLDDGARGAQAIHRHGGRVLVQDPTTAEAADMPRATMRTGCADFVLPLHALPTALTALIMVPGVAQFFVVPHAPHTQPYREALRIWGA